MSIKTAFNHMCDSAKQEGNTVRIFSERGGETQDKQPFLARLKSKKGGRE